MGRHLIARLFVAKSHSRNRLTAAKMSVFLQKHKADLGGIKQNMLTI